MLKIEALYSWLSCYYMYQSWSIDLFVLLTYYKQLISWIVAKVGWIFAQNCVTSRFAEFSSRYTQQAAWWGRLALWCWYWGFKQWATWTVASYCFCCCWGLVESSGNQLVLAGFIEAARIALSSGFPVVALACKRWSRQYLDSGEYANQRHTTHLYAGCGHKWDVAPQVQGNPKAELAC